MSLRTSAALALAILGCAPAQGVPGPDLAPERDSAACEYREVGRKRLLVENGRQLYVEPYMMQANTRGDLLLAGRSNYLFEQAADGRWVRARRDSIFGAVIPLEGEPQVVPSPVPTKLLGKMRAAARQDGKWDVVFTELISPNDEQATDTVARLWHGVLEGARWHSLHVLPHPPGVGLHNGVSSLVRYGDTLAWAVKISSPDRQLDLLLYESRAERWSHEVVRIRGFAYGEIGHADTLGLVLAIVQPDSSLRGDGNSLFLWERQPSWHASRKLMASSTESVHDPWLGRWAERQVVSWEAQIPVGDGGGRREVHAMAGAVLAGPEPVLVLDTSFTSMSPVAPVSLPGGGYVWVLDHSAGRDRDREIRFVQITGPGVVQRGSIPNPFYAGFASGARSASEIVTAGALLDTEQDIVVSLLLQTRFECAGNGT